MKKLNKITFGLIAISYLMPFFVMAQEETKPSPFTVGADIYSSYVWRGAKFGGPCIQPSVKLTLGGFSAGVWGSYDVTGYKETDPFLSYSLPFGLSLGVTDYYYEGDIDDFSDSTGSHALEGNLGYTFKSLTLSANYIFNEAGGAASMGGDMYFQVTYAFKNFSAFVGAGNGWHTINENIVYDANGNVIDEGDDKFNVCNIGIQASKTITITDKFSIPVTGQIIVNPDNKKAYMVVGLTF